MTADESSRDPLSTMINWYGTEIVARYERRVHRRRSDRFQFNSTVLITGAHGCMLHCIRRSRRSSNDAAVPVERCDLREARWISRSVRPSDITAVGRTEKLTIANDTP